MRIVFVFLAIVLAACQSRSVARIDPSTSLDLSGRWNDSDSRRVAEEMTKNLLSSDRFKSYAEGLDHKPVIVVGQILNRTSEHIDADNYIKKFELAIFESGTADIVESEGFRDKLRVERAQQQDFADPATMARWGMETGADLMLLGEMLSEVDVYNKRRVVNYVTTLYLTDIETNKRIWYGQHEIKKYVKN